MTYERVWQYRGYLGGATILSKREIAPGLFIASCTYAVKNPNKGKVFVQLLVPNRTGYCEVGGVREMPPSRRYGQWEVTINSPTDTDVWLRSINATIYVNDQARALDLLERLGKELVNVDAASKS